MHVFDMVVCFAEKFQKQLGYSLLLWLLSIYHGVVRRQHILFVELNFFGRKFILKSPL